MSFFDDFLVDKENFNKKLKLEEYLLADQFPNARNEELGFLGVGAIRPDKDTCSQYHCWTLGIPILLFDPETGESLGEIKLSSPSL